MGEMRKMHCTAPAAASTGGHNAPLTRHITQPPIASFATGRDYGPTGRRCLECQHELWSLWFLSKDHSTNQHKQSRNLHFEQMNSPYMVPMTMTAMHGPTESRQYRR